MTQIQQHVGRRVRELRNQAGITQQELADFLQKSRATICNAEAGRQGLDTESLYLICCAFSCTANDLFPPVQKATIETVSEEKTIVKKTRKVKITGILAAGK